MEIQLSGIVFTPPLPDLGATLHPPFVFGVAAALTFRAEAAGARCHQVSPCRGQAAARPDTLHGADPLPSDPTAPSEQVPQALRGSGGRLEGAMEEAFLLPSAETWLGLGLVPLERPCPPQGT